MKKFFSLLILLTGSFIFSCKSQQFPELAPKDFANAIADSNAILIDVRTPEEYKNGHLKNSVLIDFFEENFYDRIGAYDKNKKIYLYCRSGSRSGEAQEKMISMGFKYVVNLKGGYQQWKDEGMGIEK